MITSLLHRMTDFSASRRGKFVTILLWIVVLGALKGVAPNLTSLYNNAIQQDIPSDAGSQVAQRLLLKSFPSNRGTPAILVFYDAHGLSVDDRIRIKQASDWLISKQKPAPVGTVISPFTVPQATAQLISRDGTTMTVVAAITTAATDQATLGSVKTIRQYLLGVTAQSPLQVELTGPAGIVTDLTGVFSSVDVKLLLTTIGLVFLLLIVLYRSPLLALLPLVAVGIALQVVNALLGFGAKAGLFSISSMSASIATVLLFGAGTDYSIFIASRFREELEYTQDKHIAMQQTMRAVGEAITSSAATVILALLTLLFASLGLYTSLGPTLAIAIIVMLLAGLTLVPALIVWLGRAAYWPFIPRYQPEKAVQGVILDGFWGRIGRWAVKRRVLAVVGSTLFLVILALGNSGVQPTFNDLASFRIATPSTNGFALLQRHFPAGELAPTTVLLQLRGENADAYQHLQQLDAVAAALQKVPGVATVSGPTRPEGKAPQIDLARLQAGIDALPSIIKDAIRRGETPVACSGSSCPVVGPQYFATIGAYAASTQYIAADTTTVQFSITLQDDPYSLAAIKHISTLGAVSSQALAANGLGPNAATSASVYLAGQTAQLADRLNYTNLCSSVQHCFLFTAHSIACQIAN